MEWYVFFSSFVNFLSETDLIWRATSQASLCSSCTSNVKGDLGFSCLFRLLCHPSTSLLMWICCLYTLLREWGQELLCTWVLSTYSTNLCRGLVVACSWRQVNIAGIWHGGRNGKVIILQRYLKVLSIFYAVWRPNSWIFNVKKNM